MNREEWNERLIEDEMEIVRRSPEQLVPFLESRAREAEEKGYSDELYRIISTLILLMLKEGHLDKALEWRKKQEEIKALVSPDTIGDTGSNEICFARFYVRQGLIREAEQEIRQSLRIVPIGSQECPEVLLVLSEAFYAEGDLRKSLFLWLKYIQLTEFYLFAIENELIRRHPFPNITVSYPYGIKSIFSLDDEEMKEKVAAGCLHLCRLLLDSSGRYLSIIASDTDFLSSVSQWLSERGELENVDVINRCISLYRHSFEYYKRLLGMGDEGILAGNGATE